MNGTDPSLVDPGTVFSVAGLLYALMAIAGGLHVVLNKRNESSALTWLGIIVLSPFFGVALYWLFGINRIRRRAVAELQIRAPCEFTSLEGGHEHIIDTNGGPWEEFMRLGMAIHSAPYLKGNTIEPFVNGDAAYPAMIHAIDAARHSVVLSSYIFEYDAAGKRFVEALVSARQRGVEVRVLIDGVGVGYGFSLVRADRVLRRRGVKTARFLSTLSTSGTRFINLRNHRKILVVDGQLAFMGGMNIRANNLLETATRHATRDVHFRIFGPVVNQIQAVFVDDWEFASQERLRLPAYRSDADGDATRRRLAEPRPTVANAEQASGRVVARVLLDGPDDNYLKLQLTIVAAVNQAQERVRVVTPYFLPDRIIYQALQMAVLRGVKVEVLIPSKNNLPPVDWAMRANEDRLLKQGVKIWRTPPPFDHSKLFLVDRDWALIGSSNWDARSLELNFEINLECYDAAFNRQVDDLFTQKQAAAVPVSIESGASTGLLLQLRNNFFRLFSPYL